ncbi:MAG: aldo/keto reductase [Bacteroidales bacterium]|nr:aldo/keto reductase [Candidatus Colimorpha merdihippi]
MNRRDFLKSLGAGTLATAAIAAGCDSPNKTQAEGFELGEVPTDQMTYRTGTHGEKVSVLGYGQMRLPTVEEGNRDSDLDQDRINELTDYALSHGVNLFDTAPRYCKARSEAAIGIALSRHNRDEYLISTKLSNMSPDTLSFEGSKAMFEESLRRLQTDHVDFYMLHCVGLPCKGVDGETMDPMTAFKVRFEENGMLDWLMEQRKLGRIRNLGFSYHGDVKVFDYALSLHGKVHWDHVLIQHNYINWQHAGDLAEDGDSGDANSEYLYGQLAERNIPIFVMEPLLGGQLANLPQFAVDELKRRAPNQSLASWAFRFAANQPRILTVLSGMTYMEHLQDNIRTLSPHKPLSEDELKMLADIANRYAGMSLVPCTGCQYCMPCPYGLDIPGIFAHYNKMLNEGNAIKDLAEDASSEERRAYRKARRAYLKNYNKAVDPDRQAEHCIACGRCLSECPQQINIPRQMAMIEKLG